MKTKALILSGAAFLCISLTQVSGQSPLFTGEWNFNKEKSTTQNNQLFLSKITVLQKTDSLFTTRVYQNEYGELYPFKENLPLNGQEGKIVIYDMPRKAKASLSANSTRLNFESTTTFYGNSGPDDLNSKETWSIENGGKALKIDYTLTYSAGSNEGTLYFDMAE
jgi:hypothetical protein